MNQCWNTINRTDWTDYATTHVNCVFKRLWWHFDIKIQKKGNFFCVHKKDDLIWSFLWRNQWWNTVNWTLLIYHLYIINNKSCFCGIQMRSVFQFRRLECTLLDFPHVCFVLLQHPGACFSKAVFFCWPLTPERTQRGVFVSKALVWCKY